jgi:hypothetical protein
MVLIRQVLNSLPRTLVLALLLSGVVTAGTRGAEPISTATNVGDLKYGMVSLPIPNAPGYSRGSGTAEVQVEGTTMAIHMEAEGTAPNTRFMLIVTVNGTTHSVVNMTSDEEGGVEAEGTLSMNQGHYSLGLQLYDMSSFPAPTMAMVSSPTSVNVGLSQRTTSILTSRETQSATTVHGNGTEDDQIRTAIQTKLIPAVVKVEESGASTYTTDTRFSVSVGRFLQDGYVVSISAKNVTGPKVLLLNLTAGVARNLFSNPVTVTLDGSELRQAGSTSEVLGAKTGDPASFVLVSTPSGLSMLISIPKFSSHVIEILPTIARIAAVLQVDLPVFALSVAVVSTFVLLAYARRPRFHV